MGRKNFWSPLRYPGGKIKVASIVRDILIENEIVGATYIEPFAGGAGVALYLLFGNYTDKIIINDFDKRIFALWYSILNYSEELIEMIYNTPITIQEWEKHRSIVMNQDEDISLLELGFSTLFLNRTNRSGIIKAGPIGGFKQQGKYLIDCRFNKEDLIYKIREINKKKSRIRLYNLDAVEFIKKVVNKQRKKAFIFFDPPYFKKGRELYTNFYSYQDHLALYNEIKKIQKHAWITTYDVADEIIEIYSDLSYREFIINHSAANKGKSSELLFCSEGLVLPKSFYSLLITKDDEEVKTRS
ncbi:DNA adenine methylase [Lihuaxuella thermophila]|uniref:site-specific DNA-methyltransferase (adenine-specific) n=1 Tax=Lihuaxuella thermophila TaxID=1173111 RepID=A0A1H8FR04_9BACL|nr:DNA adenine methylase [Lihuaxuella thermophila]SEN33687.1 DNA adenine methylase [Lihuaxuella thermophila]